MSEKSASQLIRELVTNLAPVRPIPRLRDAASLVALLWLVSGVGILTLRGLRPDLLQRVATESAFLTIIVGLALVGLGGAMAALAMGVPGRAHAARVGLGLGLAGVILAAGMGTFLVLRESGGVVACPFQNDLACISVSSLLALPPALGILVFLSRGSPFRPLLAVLTGATGAVALGALLVHVTCPEASPRHVILSHALAPFIGALLLTLPFRAALKRFPSR